MSKEHYELVRKYSARPMPEFGATFVYKGVKYEVVGAVLAGNKLRALNSADGKVYLFLIKDLAKKYGVKCANNTGATDGVPLET